MGRARSEAPPADLDDLLRRARALGGRRLDELDPRLPERRGKGAVGQLVEQVLGASAASRDEPDFPALGVELKTIPIDRRGHPKEVTYVCRVSFRNVADERWESSRVRRKLQRVLFLPVEADPAIPIGERQIGAACLFELGHPHEARLRRDWELLSGLIAAGEAEALTSRVGDSLHIRPKASNSRVRALGPGEEDGQAMLNPKGYYLRRSFTAAVLRDAGLV